MAPRAVWKNRLILIAMLSGIIFVSLLPLGRLFGQVPGPDLAMCLIFAFVLRRPDYVPMGLIVVMGFLADALLSAPLGLWTLILLVATEFLRRGVIHTEALTPADEAAQVVPVMLACFVVERLVLLVLVADAPALTSLLIHAGVTVLFYPLIVVFIHSVLGVRRLQPGELDTLGSRA